MEQRQHDNIYQHKVHLWFTRSVRQNSQEIRSDPFYVPRAQCQLELMQNVDQYPNRYLAFL